MIVSVVAFAVVWGIGFLLLHRWLNGPSPDAKALAERVARAQPFDEASDGAVAKVEGIVRVGDDGVLKAPIGGALVAFVRIAIEEDEGESFAERSHVDRAQPFTIERADGSRIEVDAALTFEALRHALQPSSSGPVIGPSEAVAAFLGADREQRPDEFPRRRKYEQRALSGGQRVLALGIKSLRRQPGSPAYRDAPEGNAVTAGLAVELVRCESEEQLIRVARLPRPDLFDLIVLGGGAGIVALMAGMFAAFLAGVR